MGELEHPVKVTEEVFKEIEALKVHPKQPAGEVVGKAVGLLKAFRIMRKEFLDEALDNDHTLSVEQKQQLKGLFDKI